MLFFNPFKLSTYFAAACKNLKLNKATLWCAKISFWMCNIFSRHHHPVKCHCLSYIFIPIFICFTLVAPQKCYLQRKSPLYFSPQSLSMCDMCKYNFLRRKYISLMHSTETIAFSWDVWRKKEREGERMFLFFLFRLKRDQRFMIWNIERQQKSFSS